MSQPLQSTGSQFAHYTLIDAGNWLPAEIPTPSNNVAEEVLAPERNTSWMYYTRIAISNSAPDPYGGFFPVKRAYKLSEIQVIGWWEIDSGEPGNWTINNGDTTHFHEVHEVGKMVGGVFVPSIRTTRVNRTNSPIFNPNFPGEFETEQIGPEISARDINGGELWDNPSGKPEEDGDLVIRFRMENWGEGENYRVRHRYIAPGWTVALRDDITKVKKRVGPSEGKVETTKAVGRIKTKTLIRNR